MTTIPEAANLLQPGHNEDVPKLLAHGEVHVWYQLTAAADEGEVEQALTLLSSDERARYQRFTFARDRRDYALAHGLLRRSLSRYAEAPPQAWRFRERPGGKPILLADERQPSLSYSISHTRGLVACAIVSGAEIGIDVEPVAPSLNDGVAQAFFSAAENAALNQCASASDRAILFCELWTLKEAYVKAIGTGLLHPLNTISFGFDGGGAVAFTPSTGVDPASWQFALFSSIERYRLAVAVALEFEMPYLVRLMTAEQG